MIIHSTQYVDYFTIYFKTISESFEVKNKFITNKINSQSDKRITKKDEIGFTYGMYIFFSYFVMNQFFGVKISQASRDFSLTYSAQSFRKYISRRDSRLVNYELKLFLKANLYFGATTLLCAVHQMVLQISNPKLKKT